MPMPSGIRPRRRPRPGQPSGPGPTLSDSLGAKGAPGSSGTAPMPRGWPWDPGQGPPGGGAVPFNPPIEPKPRPGGTPVPFNPPIEPKPRPGDGGGAVPGNPTIEPKPGPINFNPPIVRKHGAINFNPPIEPKPGGMPPPGGSIGALGGLANVDPQTLSDFLSFIQVGGPPRPRPRPRLGVG